MMRRTRQGGFAFIAAIIFLVALAAFALAMLRLQNSQQVTIDGGIQGMRAAQAARGGLEWAFYQLRGGSKDACNGTGGMNGRTLGDFVADTGFKVTLSCSAYDYNEGQDPASSNDAPKPQVKRIFEIDAVACNGANAACPDAASVPNRDYVERKRSASICSTPDGKACY